jgi:hypothetical protein
MYATMPSTSIGLGLPKYSNSKEQQRAVASKRRTALLTHISPIEHDRIFSDDIQRISQLIEDKVLLRDFSLECEQNEGDRVQ